MALLTNPDEQLLLKGLINSNVFDALSMGHINRARRFFKEACVRVGIESLEDIPEDAMPYGINLRRMFIEARYGLSDNPMAELTEFELSEARRLDIKYIVRLLPDLRENTFK